MIKGSSTDQGDSFSSVGDDLLEMRFSSESIQVFHKSLADFESILPTRSYDIPVHFFGNFDNKSKDAIQNLVNESFVNAEKHGLQLEHHKPEVSFYTRSSWESGSNKPLKKGVSLPAARLSSTEGIPMVELIIPEKISTSEEVIKTVRLLFSKLFGILFFGEHVPQKPAFRLLVDEEEALTFDVAEKAHFCHFTDQFTQALLKEFDRIGRELHIKGPKSRDFGKKEFFNRLLLADPAIENSSQKLLSEAFQIQLLSLKENPILFFDKLIEKFFSLNPQTTILLPYDIRNFRSLAEKRQWTIFHAFEERLQLIINSFAELAECRDYLEQASDKKPLEYAVLSAWKNTFSERIKTLKRLGYAKPFLIEGAKLSTKQTEMIDRFPLWIWQHCKPDRDSTGKKTESHITSVTNQYKNSVYQKLFEAALRMHNCLNIMQSEEKHRFSECGDFPRIKTILAWLDIRKISYTDMLFTSRVGSQLGNLAGNNKVGKQEALEKFEQGWSYFVSFAMVHQYLLTLKKRSRQDRDRSEQFFSLIEKFVRARIKSQPSFQISGLLIEFYNRRQFNLKKVSALIRKETQILDYFILNQQSIFNNQSKSPAETIDHFSGSLIQWQDQRDEQDIRPEELEELKISTST